MAVVGKYDLAKTIYNMGIKRTPPILLLSEKINQVGFVAIKITLHFLRSVGHGTKGAIREKFNLYDNKKTYKVLHSRETILVCFWIL